MIAAWNTFVLEESARTPVRGMAEFYRGILAGHPQFEPVAGIGGVVTLIGAAVFAGILFCTHNLKQPA
jgi:hypothetical protein